MSIFMQIFAGSPREGAPNDSGVDEMTILWCLVAYCLGNFRHRGPRQQWSVMMSLAVPKNLWQMVVPGISVSASTSDKTCALYRISSLSSAFQCSKKHDLE